MCLALLRLDLLGAWEANPAILCLLPLGAVVTVNMILRYIKTGSSQPGKFANTAMWLMAAVLALFGILRNLPVLVSWI